jgi:hypothetical protein
MFLVVNVNVCNDLSGDEVEDYSAALQAAKRSLSEAEPPSLYVDEATNSP